MDGVRCTFQTVLHMACSVFPVRDLFGACMIPWYYR